MQGGAVSSVKIARLDTAAPTFEADLARLRHWSDDTDRAVEDAVTTILADVRARGDAAVLEYTARFDRLEVRSMAELEIGRDELKRAFDRLPSAQRDALETAARRVRHYHEHQLRASCQSWQVYDSDGTLLGQKVTPIDRVGIYVPGGKAAYPSSVLMNAIPAHVAGVDEIVMVVPTPGGERNALVLAAAHLAGAHRVFTLGGAQAIAALAYGTASVPRVDKITGRATPTSRAQSGAYSARSAST
jgi:histidinol dehydrogenase